MTGWHILACTPACAESGGICTFCGKRVTLRYADGSTNMTGDEATAAAGPSSAAGAASSSASGEAAGELAGFKPESQQGNAADAVAYNDSQVGQVGQELDSGCMSLSGVAATASCAACASCQSQLHGASLLKQSAIVLCRPPGCCCCAQGPLGRVRSPVGQAHHGAG